MKRRSFLCHPPTLEQLFWWLHLSRHLRLPVKTPLGRGKAALWPEGTVSGLGKGTFAGLRCGRGGQAVKLCPRVAVHYGYTSSILEVRFKDRLRVRGDALVADRAVVVSSPMENGEPMGNRSEMTGLMLPSLS